MQLDEYILNVEPTLGGCFCTAYATLSIYKYLELSPYAGSYISVKYISIDVKMFMIGIMIIGHAMPDYNKLSFFILSPFFTLYHKFCYLGASTSKIPSLPYHLKLKNFTIKNSIKIRK